MGLIRTAFGGVVCEPTPESSKSIGNPALENKVLSNLDRSSSAGGVAEGRGGVVKKFPGHTTPSARTNDASRLLLNRAATPYRY